MATLCQCYTNSTPTKCQQGNNKVPIDAKNANRIAKDTNGMPTNKMLMRCQYDTNKTTMGYQWNANKTLMRFQKDGNIGSMLYQ